NPGIGTCVELRPVPRSNESSLKTESCEIGVARISGVSLADKESIARSVCDVRYTNARVRLEHPIPYRRIWIRRRTVGHRTIAGRIARKRQIYPVRVVRRGRSTLVDPCRAGIGGAFQDLNSLGSQRARTIEDKLVGR